MVGGDPDAYGGYSSVVERQIVALDVVGSSPTILPSPFLAGYAG